MTSYSGLVLVGPSTAPSTHRDLPKVPAHTADPGTFQPLAEPAQFEAIKEEEQAAISAAAALPPANYDVEPPYSLIHTEEDD